MSKSICGNLLIFLFALSLMFHVSSACAGEGMIQVQSDPSGAKVYIDGNLKSTTPFDVTVSSGEHKIVIKKVLEDKSYYYYEDEVLVGSGVRKTIRAELDRVYTEAYYYEKANDLEGYNAYLEACPNGEHAQEINRKREQYYYNRADDLNGYNAYLEAYPNGKHAQEIKRKREQYYYSHADDLEDYNTYLEKYPNGKHAHEIKRKKERFFYKKALKKNDIDFHFSNKYLEKYPNGKYTQEIKNRIKKFREKIQTWTEPNTGMEFVYVPGGCYQMGCGSWTDNCEDNEKPVHKVCVDGFWIGKYEVTIDEYREFLQSTGDTDGVDWDDISCPIEKGGSYSLSGNDGFSQNGDQPMVEVSWHGAQAMAEWLSDKTGKTFRLPTEAEWEYAARSGGKRQKYAGGDDVDEVAWHDCAYTHKVGTKSSNDLGIYDMSGNVWEWCSDWYSDDYYSNSPKNNPEGPTSGYRRVIRGGSYDDEGGVKWMRTTFRNYADPTETMGYEGLRLVMTE